MLNQMKTKPGGLAETQEKTLTTKRYTLKEEDKEEATLDALSKKLNSHTAVRNIIKNIYKKCFFRPLANKFQSYQCGDNGVQLQEPRLLRSLFA